MAIVLPDPRVEPTVSVMTGARLIGIRSKEKAYAAAHDGTLPVLRVGGHMRVPTAQLLRMLGHDPDRMVAGEFPAEVESDFVDNRDPAA